MAALERARTTELYDRAWLCVSLNPGTIRPPTFVKEPIENLTQESEPERPRLALILLVTTDKISGIAPLWLRSLAHILTELIPTFCHHVDFDE